MTSKSLHNTNSRLVAEMRETPRIISEFPLDIAASFKPHSDTVMFSGEGSSRLFPAKYPRYRSLVSGAGLHSEIDGAMQTAEYDLRQHHLYVSSNSGRTAEVVRLLESCRKSGFSPVRATAVVAHDNTPVGHLADDVFVLTCGPEYAVAATKSVVEQALFFDTVLRISGNRPMPDTQLISEAFDDVLATPVPDEIMRRAEQARYMYFAGRNDGVAEELALKTNEIARMHSDFLEGTYAVHGIEEVMQPSDLVVLVDPFPDQEKKFAEVLTDGVGLEVIAISSRPTGFPTIQVPDIGEYNQYVQLAAGWNLLVEIGLSRGVNVDKPVRARKVGNEVATGTR